MATAAEVRRRIDADLCLISEELAFLPEMAAHWSTETDVNRDVYYLEWRNLMAVLDTLDREFRCGTMTAEQQARYSIVLRELHEALPIIRQLGLNPPAEALEP